MKSTKRIAVWIALMLASAFCFNLIGTLIVKTFLGDVLMPSMVGYSSKGEQMLHPTLKEPDETNKTNGLSALAVRALLSNIRLVDKTNFAGNFLFLNVSIDQTVILFDKNGMSNFSKGIFANVYAAEDGESLAHIRNITGLLSVDDFCTLDCAEEVYKTLENTPSAVIKIDSYSISDFLIQPASFTILDSNGNTVRTFKCPCDGEVIHSDNTYIYDAYERDSDHPLHDFYDKMRDTYLGERTSDKVAEKLVDKIDFANGDQYVNMSGFGFGHYLGKSYEVRGDYAMISVFDINFIDGVIMYIIIACIPITLVAIFSGRKKKNKF